jgi:hypothetical protein
VDSFLLGADSRQAQVVLHWQYSGSTPTASALTAFCADWQAQNVAQLKYLMNNSNEYASTTMTDIASSTGKQGFLSTPVTGNLSGTLLPANVAFVMGHSIGRRYRGGKPRSYYPWGDGGKTGGANTWSAGFVTLCNTNFAAAVVAFVGATSGGTTISGLVSVSYYSGFTVVTSPTTGRSRNVPKLRAGGPVVDPVVTSTGSSTYGTQRRRLRTS